MDKPTLTLAGKTYPIKRITIGDWLDISKYEEEKAVTSIPIRIGTELDFLSKLFGADRQELLTLDMEYTWPLYSACLDYLIDIWVAKLPKVSSEEGEVRSPE